ncbi:hypothetical protein E4U23_008600 [Claviceps purpurea]|nr:hypothetical protein E4U23_008600 [Claviceps purpurea]
MNLCHILNPPGEFPRQMPPTIDIHRHVTQGSTSPHAGLESAQSQSGIPPGNGMQIGAGWPFPHHLPSAEQLAPITIPLAQLPTDPSQTGPLEELEYSVLSAIPGVDIPLETKSGTKEAQERRNRNASSSRQSRDNKRLIKARAELIKKQKEMKQELEEEREKRLAAEENARRVDAENERLRRENEELRQSK